MSLQRVYTKEALDNFSNMTSVVDTPEVVLARINAVNQSDVSIFFKCHGSIIRQLNYYARLCSIVSSDIVSNARLLVKCYVSEQHRIIV